MRSAEEWAREIYEGCNRAVALDLLNRRFASAMDEARREALEEARAVVRAERGEA